MPKIFNVEDYNSSYVMYCPEEWMAKAFCTYLSKHGKKWNNGEDYLCSDGSVRTSWSLFGSKTYYRFNASEFGGTYGNIHYVADDDDHILSYLDFDWDNVTPESWDNEEEMSSFLEELKCM